MAKILVIDDDKSIVEMLKHVLSRSGYEVITAENGLLGLEAIKQQKPDLIILDVMMPEMDGFTVSGALFKDPDLRKIPIMILTAKGNSRDILSLVPNVTMYMEKPFESETLRQNVKKCLTPAS